ncbi:DUF6153 family protein [Streptomyces sp. NPDC007983]|uniref:DUF6153 family protein n=1 Tax=Streptomyces sp. NPDC007983 TaxID=3364800 RepID=UPI0036ED7C5B
MITARSRFGIRWARSVASPLRLLCLAALLLGFVSLHAVSAEAVSGHLTGCMSSPVASATHGETPGETEGPGHHDDESAHSAHECVLAQPEHGPELTAPCPALPAEGAPGAERHTPSSYPAATTAAGSAPPDLQRTAVLRI